jgi:hypothetical protein
MPRSLVSQAGSLEMRRVLASDGTYLTDPLCLGLVVIHQFLDYLERTYQPAPNYRWLRVRFSTEIYGATIILYPFVFFPHRYVSTSSSSVISISTNSISYP